MMGTLGEVREQTMCPAQVSGREPCRYAPQGGSTYCSRHDPDTLQALPVDRARWCDHGLGKESPCQRHALQGSRFCEGHDPEQKAKRKAEVARRHAEAKEREARATLLLALGDKPGALVFLFTKLVETHTVTWSALRSLAEREGLIPWRRW